MSENFEKLHSRKHENEDKNEQAIRADERERLAKMAPEEAIEAGIKILEIYNVEPGELWNWEYWKGQRRRTLVTKILAKVWPIAEARIQAEREKVLREVVALLSHEGISLETYIELDNIRKEEFKAINKYRKDMSYPKHPWGVAWIVVSLDTWQSLKRGKLPEKTE